MNRDLNLPHNAFKKLDNEKAKISMKDTYFSFNPYSTLTDETSQLEKQLINEKHLFNNRINRLKQLQ